MVHNGLDTLLLDFLWAHLNSLDWPIKSSGPICVCVICGIYKLLIYLYIYTHKGKRKWLFCSVLFCSVFSWGLRRARTAWILQSTHRDCILGVGKGRAHWTRIFYSITNWVYPWTPVEHRNDFLWDQSR